MEYKYTCNINKTALSYIEKIRKYSGAKSPLVVIRCIAYNHQSYIRDALNGFISQKTDFPFIAIVHDDASTDDTANIIREYAEKYPDIIFPILDTENQHCKYDGSLRNIMDEACAVSKAKYIALCEGDDYWIDPYKLQKQVDFLESHSEYSMCFGNAIEHWQDGTNPDKQFSHIESRDYRRIELIENWIVPTGSVIYRLPISRDKQYHKLMLSGKMIAGDIVLFLTCFSYGKVRGFNDIFSVYRRLQSGAVMSNIDKHPYKFMVHEITLGKAFGNEILKFFKHKTANRAVLELKRFKDSRKFNFKYFFRAVQFAPSQSIKQIFKYL